MKGLVFTEFLEMVENRFGITMTDKIIQGAKLSSGAAYTSVGDYDHLELVALVLQLNAETKIPVPDLLRVFGKDLFGRFVAGYPQLFKSGQTAFGFLQNIESYIHSEVRKLYPIAELPTFECRETQQCLIMIYRSQRPFADLAEGLIAGCIEHFGEALDLSHEDLSGNAGTSARFTITRRGMA